MATIGSLDQRVQVQQRGTSANGYGEPVATWTTLAEVWASVESQGGVEQFRAGKVEEAVTYTVEVRYLPFLSGKNRFLWKGKVLEIDSVRADRRMEWQVCICHEVVN